VARTDQLRWAYNGQRRTGRQKARWADTSDRGSQTVKTGANGTDTHDLRKANVTNCPDKAESGHSSVFSQCQPTGTEVKLHVM
jgi:hypothetical protein